VSAWGQKVRLDLGEGGIQFDLQAIVLHGPSCHGASFGCCGRGNGVRDRLGQHLVAFDLIRSLDRSSSILARAQCCVLKKYVLTALHL
jgi:hypothetical protein